eukprot:gene2385-13277_t
MEDDCALVEGVCRQRHSAEFAIAAWGSKIEPLLSARKAVILGSCDEAGARRACPARRFFSGLASTVRRGETIPLEPTSQWLEALRVGDSSVWDLSSDDDMLAAVPLDVGDPCELAAALEAVLDTLQRPPYSPVGALPEGVHPADIAYVEYGDGWQMLQLDRDPRPGNDVIVRHTGGIDWCIGAGKSHALRRGRIVGTAATALADTAVTIGLRRWLAEAERHGPQGARARRTHTEPEAAARYGAAALAAEHMEGEAAPEPAAPAGAGQPSQ